MLGQVLVTAPASEPVSLEEVKLFVRIEESDEDALLAGLITSARSLVEAYVGRVFIGQSWRLWMDATDVEEAWARRWVLLPKAPLIAVTQLCSFDEKGEATVLEPATYEADTAGAPARVMMKDDVSWPVPLRRMKTMAVDYVAGYGTAASDVPDLFKTAIKQVVAFWYENRGDGEAGGLPVSVKAILDPMRLRSLGGM